MQNATENKEILEVEVLISEKDLQSNPEIIQFYDAKNQKLRFELNENLTKDFKEKLLSLMPSFKAGDIVQFNPLISAVNQLQEIKILIPDADEDFKINERTLIDNNKIIGSFNSSLAKAKKIIKEPHVDFNKKVDDLFKIFETEAENTRNSLEKNFKEIVDKREEVKLEKDKKKKAAELEQIQNLQQTNEEQAEILKNSEFEKTCLELENTLNKILNNVIEKIPTLNLDGLNAMISALKVQKDTDYITPAHGFILGGQKQQEFIDLFKSKITTSIQMIGSKINEVQLQKEMEKRGIPNPNQEQPNPSLDNGTPVAPTIFEEVETELPTAPVVQSFEEVKSETQPFIPRNDIERFQVIADFDKRMLDMYKDGMEQIKALSFDNKSLEELKTKYSEGQHGNVLEFLTKLQTFSSNKYEAVKQALS